MESKLELSKKLYSQKKFTLTKTIYLYKGGQSPTKPPYQWWLTKEDPHGAYVTLTENTVIEVLEVKSVVSGSTPSTLNIYMHFTPHSDSKNIFSGFFVTDHNLKIIEQVKSDIFTPAISTYLISH